MNVKKSNESKEERKYLLCLRCGFNFIPTQKVYFCPKCTHTALQRVSEKELPPKKTDLRWR